MVSVFINFRIRCGWNSITHASTLSWISGCRTDLRADMPSFLWEVCFDYFDTDRGIKAKPHSFHLNTYRELDGFAEATIMQTFSILKSVGVIKPAQSKRSMTWQTTTLKSNKNALDVRICRTQIPYHASVKQLPVPGVSSFPDIENLPPVAALNSVQAEIDRKIALERIAEQEWDFVNPEKLPITRHLSSIFDRIHRRENRDVPPRMRTSKTVPALLLRRSVKTIIDPEVQKAARTDAPKKAQRKRTWGLDNRI